MSLFGRANISLLFSYLDKGKEWCNQFRSPTSWDHNMFFLSNKLTGYWVMSFKNKSSVHMFPYLKHALPPPHFSLFLVTSSPLYYPFKLFAFVLKDQLWRVIFSIMIMIYKIIIFLFPFFILLVFGQCI